MNASKSEDISVATMDAISCGIPIITAGVGGNKEIVSGKNGLLLPANLASHERRAGSCMIWNERYEFSLNFSAFTQRLLYIRREVGRID